MGIGKFQTPTKLIPLNRSIKNSAKLIAYVHERTPYAKFGTNTHTRVVWANGRNITKIIFYLFIPFFLRLAYRSDLLMDFYAR